MQSTHPSASRRPRTGITRIDVGYLALASLLGVAAAIVAPDTRADELLPTYIGSQSVKITASGFDFGGNTFVAGAPTGSGDVHWHIVDGQINPIVDGTLHLNDVQGLCARMRVDYYVNSSTVWTTRYGGEVCAPDDKHHAYSVALGEYTSNKISEVKVSVEKKTASQDWQSVGSQRVKLITTHSSVKITEDGFDFGGQTFIGSGPTNSGEIAWSWSGGQITPHLTGTLHINNAASACARMRIEYYSATDERLSDQYGGKVCAVDNKHHSWNVDLKPFDDGKIVWVRVSLQNLGADEVWRTVGSHSVSYAIKPIALCGGGGGCLRRELK